MPFKDWFNSPSRRSGEELDVEDLITLERYQEAEDRLRRALAANPSDLRAQQRLGDVYLRMGNPGRAAEHLVSVADAFARDGFYDRAIALLSQVRRCDPSSPVAQRLERLERTRRLEGLRVGVTRQLVGAAGRGGLRLSPLEVNQAWRNLSESSLMEQLDGAQLERLLAAGELVRCPPERLLARRGERLRRLYLVILGTVAAEVSRPEGAPVRLRAFTVGDLLGDGALLQQRPWPADYRCAETAVLLAVEADGLERALQGNPDPRRLIDALRGQHSDGSVAAAVARLHAEVS